MTDQYMTPARFANKIEWEGGIVEALDYGLKSTDLDPNDEAAKPLREAWAELEKIHTEQFQPAANKVSDILESFEGQDED